MPLHRINRRDFQRLALAAWGGSVLGTLAGCGERLPSKIGGPPATPASGINVAAAGEGSKNLVVEMHLCRGLNACKGQGASGKNECAGRGTCSSLKHHDCGGQNECKGQGGCGEDPGLNACKTKGGCAVPLMDDAWTKVRKRFEESMTKAAKPFGTAPAKAS